MPQVTTIQLTGWKAVLAAVALLGFTGYRIDSRVRKPDDTSREALQDWLVKDYEGLGPKALAEHVAEYRAGLEPKLDPAPAHVPVVQFTSLAAHGLPTIMVVRAQVTVDGAPPPDGRSVRYLDLTTKLGGGWMVLAESDSLSYYLALFR